MRTHYQDLRVTIDGRPALVSVTVRDYLSPGTLAQVINQAIQLDRAKRALLLKRHGISDLELNFTPETEE
jgi:hypothetical protein